jgi:hypothetical protein
MINTTSMPRDFYVYFPGKFDETNIPVGVPWHMMFLTGWAWEETYDNELDWNPDKFKDSILARKAQWEALDLYRPKPLVSIDREYYFMEVMLHVDHPKHKEAINVACDMLELAKDTWSEAQWSMYGLPRPLLSRLRPDGSKWGERLDTDEAVEWMSTVWSPIWELSDWFGPSFYKPFFNNGQPIDPAPAIKAIYKWEHENDWTKPIYPWVTHRWTSSHYGYRLFTPEEMEDHIGGILDLYKYDDNHIHTVDGLLWWYRARSNFENPDRGWLGVPCDPDMRCYPLEDHLEDIEQYIYDNLFDLTYDRGIHLERPRKRRRRVIQRVRDAYRQFKLTYAEK